MDDVDLGSFMSTFASATQGRGNGQETVKNAVGVNAATAAKLLNYYNNNIKAGVCLCGPHSQHYERQSGEVVLSRKVIKEKISSIVPHQLSLHIFRHAGSLTNAAANPAASCCKA